MQIASGSTGRLLSGDNPERETVVLPDYGRSDDHGVVSYQTRGTFLIGREKKTLNFLSKTGLLGRGRLGGYAL